MSLILQVFYCVFSGLLLAVSIPNEIFRWGSPAIAFIALVPYYIAFKNCKSYKNAFFLSSIHAFTTHMISSSWLGSFQNFAYVTLLASGFGTAFFAGFFGFFFFVPYDSAKKRNDLNLLSLTEVSTVAKRIIHFTVVYTIYEWYKGVGFFGYPWGTIPLSMFRAHIIMQLAAITGTQGITFLAALFSAVFAESITQLSNSAINKNIFNQLKHVSKLWCVLFVLSFLFGLVTFVQKRSPDKLLTTIIVQQNQNPWNSQNDTETILRSEQLTEDKLSELRVSGNKPNLIVWSEGCLKKYFPSSMDYYSRYPLEKPLIPFIRSNNIPFLAGSGYVVTKDDFTSYYNTTVAFDGRGNLRGHYAKNHLVPMAEAIPLSQSPYVKKIMRKYFGMGAGWTAGDQYTIFEIPGKWAESHIEPASKIIDFSIPYEEQRRIEKTPPTVKIATPICYDDAFNDICRPLYKAGAEIFVNLTDDSWSLKDISEIQHFVVSSYRSIEYRTTLVRSTNSGYSVVVDPAGKILADLPLFEEAALAYDIPVYNRKATTYSIFGDWFPAMLIIILLVDFGLQIYHFDKKDFVESERNLWKKTKKHKKNHKKHKKS